MKVRGLVKPRSVSGARLLALAAGDTDALLRINRQEFGGWRMMADSDDDDEDDDDDDSGDSGADDDDDADDDKSKSKDNKDDDDADDSADERLRKLEKRMRAADKRADAAEAELRKRQDAEKGDLEKATDELTEARAKVEELTGVVSSLRLENAFLTTNTHEWHDPDTARALAQSKGYLDDVTDEDTGEVDKKALKKALDRLANDHKYLVKTKSAGPSEEDSPSGESAGGRSDNTKDTKAKKQKMKNRFPVLNK